MTNLFDYIQNLTGSLITEMAKHSSTESFIRKGLSYLDDSEVKEVETLVKSLLDKKGISMDNLADVFDRELEARMDRHSFKLANGEVSAILTRNKEFDKLSMYFAKGDFISLDELVASKNAMGLIQSRVGLSKKTITDLYDIHGGDNPAIGRGEILLRLICLNISNVSGKGDVLFTDGRTLEVKGDKSPAVLYDHMWSERDISQLYDAFWGEDKNTRGLKRLSSLEKNPNNPEFERLLAQKSGIHNYDNLNKVWGAYIIYKYAQTEEFTDLIIGDFINGKEFVFIPNANVSAKEVYKCIKDKPLRFDWPVIPFHKSGGSSRCAVNFE